MSDAHAGIWRVELRPNASDDARGRHLVQQAQAAGLGAVADIEVRDLFFLDGDLDENAVKALVASLLVDPIVEHASWAPLSAPPSALAAGIRAIEVTPLPGVTDSVAESLLDAANSAGFDGLQRAASGQRYLVGHDPHGDPLPESLLRRLAGSLLANEVVQAWSIDTPLPPPFVQDADNQVRVETIDIASADDDGLLAISRERRLALDLAEMRAIAAWFRDEGRQATDLELEMLAQTWSEHCVHKTFRALIDYQELDVDGQPVSSQVVDSMYRSCIRETTQRIGKDWLRSVFVDNAGIIAFDDDFDLAFKVETHNHPSALEPFGGANTGIGGVVRDIIGVSAAPIATTDVLCFGPADLDSATLPEGVLHPRRIADGVISGIEDYGNKMGIPTVNGAIVYDPGYTANPLVFCGCLGILPRGSHRTEAAAGDLVVCIGGRTGRDGLRGATFSSMEMDMETGDIAGSAVQIGHPIHEKQALEAVRLARDAGLYTAITDCGAGGLSSAVGEMAATLGADVQLAHVPLKYAGLDPWEVWLSEAQERMVLAVPEGNWPAVEEICRQLHVDGTVLGRFTGDGRVRVHHGERLVGDLDAVFLHDGLPRRHLKATWRPPATQPPAHNAAVDLAADLLALLSTPDIRSKADVIHTYDHEVQGGTVVKPLVGVRDHGPSDAAVLLPLETVEAAPADDVPRAGAALSVGIAPQIGKLDPGAMAWAAIDETVRNLVCVGADPDRVAILDNFCWGNPLMEDRLGGLVRCALACRDAALAFGTPFISGKDSLNNEYAGADGKRHAIPGTLLISGLGIVPDVYRTATMDLKCAGSLLYLVGTSDHRLGGSAWLGLRGEAGQRVPEAQPDGLARARAVHKAIAGGQVRACHDCSEGGVAVALAEMCLAGGLGATLDLRAMPGADDVADDGALAFGEALSRYLVEVAPEQSAAFESLFDGLPCGLVGVVESSDRIVLVGETGQVVVDVAVAAADEAWGPR